MTYVSSVTQDLARIGRLSLRRGRLKLTPIETPALLPVVNLMTGTTPKGGGIWRHLLESLLRDGRPLMTQALQFLDFSLPPQAVDRWMDRRKGTVLAQHLALRQIEGYRGPLFVDSGGYKYLSGRLPNLARWGIEDGSSWRRILALQDGLGGDALFAFDLPLRAQMSDGEAAQRLAQTQANTLSLLRYLADQGRPRHVWLPVHGRSAAELSTAIAGLLTAIQSEGLHSVPTLSIGIAVGSLVPLRMGNRQADLCSMLRAVRQAIPVHMSERLPLHILGIAGSMIPVLAHYGMDTCDSSNYVQHARSLDYYDPTRRCRVPLLGWEARSLPCQCPACADQSLMAWQETLSGFREGVLRSEIYARLALHNLYWDDKLLNETKTAIGDGCLPQFLVEHAKRFPAVRHAIEVIAAEGGAEIRIGLSRQHFAFRLQQELGDEVTLPPGPIDLRKYDPGPPPWLERSTVGADNRSIRPISCGPDSFRLPADWAPKPEKQVLLVLPCSAVKPYRTSVTHRAIQQTLESRLVSLSRIQKVTLSGLYGPVPEEWETDPVILAYDYRLTVHDAAQVQLCADRLAEFLLRFREQFPLRIGYATTRAYREVMRRAALQDSGFQVLPTSLGRQQLTEFFRAEHLAALGDRVMAWLVETLQFVPGGGSVHVPGDRRAPFA
jgi:7-cyano-7-deazaguanine tRNA-ribosyltransferase